MPQPVRSPRKSVRRTALPERLVERIEASADHHTAGILRSAAELFAARSPSQVSLREVAHAAGVNYGLIHRYFRTKDNLILSLFQGFTDYGGEYIESSPDIDEAIRATFSAEAGSFAQIFSWAVLDGVQPDRVWQDSSYMAVFADHIRRSWAEPGAAPRIRPEFDPRVVGAFVMLMISMWDFFAPYMRVLNDYEDRDEADVKNEVLELMQVLVHAAAPSPRPASASKRHAKGHAKRETPRRSATRGSGKGRPASRDAE